MQVICERCGKSENFVFSNWHCECGGAWLLQAILPVSGDSIDTHENSIWRYRGFFPVELRHPQDSLGAGFTPLLPCSIYDHKVLLKLDYLMPTGSFKDRGVELMMNALALAGVRQVVEDSSGNAGASVAAYAARLGMHASIFAPAHASPAKLAQIEVYGAQVHTIPGARQNASRAVMDAVQNGMVYASHANNPVYLLGQQTAAWEIWEQMAFHVPDWVVVPVGQGGNLLGYYEGFRALLRSGMIERLPGIIAVQPQRLAPICDAYQQGWREWMPVSAPQVGSVAEGLAITQPVRWKHIVDALDQSHGFCVRVPEEQILPAQYQLAKQGFYIEPTSAVVIAALPQIFNIVENNPRVVVSLTGSGLKSPAVQN
ncbi:MAG: pyridoxal-phosphate dependent enzyme [Chloroflexi bacterium]|nr:pyridoxal-phosphate dependent enzyme [Chloroflexota bacterium]